ncbi:hypothetical protein Gogos_019020 [Gossypium gossypioides]|uniref:Uncharacterized protein n=1 Tax=Gossypium gossypioides TaxID=34282 RepID=A0A7J9BG42_GOSGO|nr:hypothetical protein [Gossypium gossypioides]
MSLQQKPLRVFRLYNLVQSLVS